MIDAELEKLIRTWEKIMTEMGPTKNMKEIVKVTLIKLYDLRRRKAA